MAGLFKRPSSPFWYYRFQWGGREFWGSTRTRSKAVAERFRAERYAQVVHGSVPREKVRVGTLADEYVRWMAGQGTGRRWVRNRTVWVRWVVEVLGGNTPVRLVGAEDIEELKAALFRTPSPRGGTLTHRTIRAYLGAVRQMFDYAVRRGYLGRSPARDVKLPPQGRPNPRFLTLEQLRLLLDAAPSPWWRALLRVAAYTGMRRGELCRFRWGDVDRDRKRIRIRQRKTNQTIEVPLHPVVERALLGLTRSTRSDRVFFDPEVSSENYDHAWENRVTHVVSTLFQKLGLEGSLHSLRHTYATLLLSASGNLKVVQEALGHRHISTTMRYAFLLREGLDDAVRRLPDLDAGEAKETAPAMR